jgi:hypothetical protein
MAAAMTILLLAGLLQAGPPAPPPVVTPLFLSRDVEDGPAFMIECRNTTGAPVSTGAMLWALDRDDLRIDGTVLEPQGRMGPGLMSEVPAGGTWRGIIELRQAEGGTFHAVALGADTRGAFVVPLTAGRHTIAARCGDQWSADLSFYWER